MCASVASFIVTVQLSDVNIYVKAIFLLFTQFCNYLFHNNSFYFHSLFSVL